MKECPFCAEEIKDAAIKCKHCGEWLQEDEKSKSVKSSKNTDDNFDEQLDQSLSETIKSNKKEATKDYEINESQESSYSPVYQAPKWGWGWIVLLVFIVPGLQKMGGISESAKALSYLFCLSLPLILFAFYFWNRRRIINKDKRGWDIKLLSLIAGFETYLIAVVVISFAMYFVTVQDKKVTENFFTQLQHTAEPIQKEQNRISKIIANTPENQQELDQYISTLKQLLQLIEKKRKLSEELLSYFDEYGIATKNDMIIDDVKEIRLVRNVHLEKTKDSINYLIGYYNSGDDELYNKYDKLYSEAATLEAEYNSLSRKLIEKVDY